MDSRLSIRSMQPVDLEFAAKCTAQEGWQSETYAGFEGFFQFDPGGCLIAELDREPAGICVATPYGDSGFVGELIVVPQLRGRGIGAALLEQAVKYLRNRGAQGVYLDGVVKAVPLYERHAFRKVCRSLRFSGILRGRDHDSVRPAQPEDLSQIFALDRSAFGADRSFFLRRRLELFPELCLVHQEPNQPAAPVSGFILGRRGQGWASAGPCVVGAGFSEARLLAARQLLESFAARIGEARLSLGVLQGNSDAVKLARSLELSEREDSPWRMVLNQSKDPVGEGERLSSSGLGMSPLSMAVGSAAKG